MRHRGVHYDTGVRFHPDRLSRERFDVEVVEYEIRAIAEDLHANAVRIIGEDLDRLMTTAGIALDAGLVVYVNPWLINRAEDEMLPFLTAAARGAERLRAEGRGEVYLVVGCESSLFAAGLVPGANVYERVDWLVSLRDGAVPTPSLEQVQERLHTLLERCVQAARSEFRGPVTYAAGSWEQVDWAQFDLIAVDYYRAEQSREEYAAGLRALVAQDKPVVVAEFGCCTYEGADRRGGMGWMNLDEWADGAPRWLVEQPPVRSERTQADYLVEQLDVFTDVAVDGAFVFTFVAPYLQHTDDPATDFDRSSFALVKSAAIGTPAADAVPPWQPKESFAALSRYYGRLAAR